MIIARPEMEIGLRRVIALKSRHNDVPLELGDEILAQRDFMKTRTDVLIGLLNSLGKFLDRDSQWSNRTG